MGSKESIKLLEELIEWSNTDRVQWESEGLMVFYDSLIVVGGWVGSNLID